MGFWFGRRIGAQCFEFHAGLSPVFIAASNLYSCNDVE